MLVELLSCAQAVADRAMEDACRAFFASITRISAKPYAHLSARLCCLHYIIFDFSIDASFHS